MAVAVGLQLSTHALSIPHASHLSPLPGQLLHDNGETVDAVEAWRLALAAAPTAGVIARTIDGELANLLETWGRLVDKSEAMNKKAFTKRVTLGYLTEVVGETDDACRMLKEELKANPKRKSSTAYLGLARCSRTQREVGEVVKYAQKYLNINTSDVGVLWMLGDAFYSRGSFKKAAEVFAKCIAADPADPRCISSATHLSHQQDDHYHARYIARDAVLNGAIKEPAYAPYRQWRTAGSGFLPLKRWWMSDPVVLLVAEILAQSFMMVQQEVLARVEDGSIRQVDATKAGNRIREYKADAIELNLFSKGDKVAKNTKLVPFTAAFLRRIAQVSTMAEGQTKILILDPGGSTPCRTGPTSARIRLLMPLVEVAGGWLSVDGENIPWVEVFS